MVCSTDFYIPTKDKLLFIKELRESGIKCYFEDAIDVSDLSRDHSGRIVNCGCYFFRTWMS